MLYDSQGRHAQTEHIYLRRFCNATKVARNFSIKKPQDSQHPVRNGPLDDSGHTGRLHFPLRPVLFCNVDNVGVPLGNRSHSAAQMPALHSIRTYRLLGEARTV